MYKISMVVLGNIATLLKFKSSEKHFIQVVATEWVFDEDFDEDFEEDIKCEIEVDIPEYDEEKEYWRAYWLADRFPF